MTSILRHSPRKFRKRVPSGSSGRRRHFGPGDLPWVPRSSLPWFSRTTDLWRDHSVGPTSSFDTRQEISWEIWHLVAAESRPTSLPQSLATRVILRWLAG